MTGPDDERRRIGDVDLDLFAFINSVFRHLAAGDDEGLRGDALAVMAPIFCEKLIEDIRLGHAWNGLLFLMVRSLLRVSPDLRYLSGELEAKRAFVAQPDASLDDIVVIERGTTGTIVRLR